MNLSVFLAQDSGADNVQEQSNGELKRLMSGEWDAALPLLEKYLLPALIALIILIVAYFIGKYLSRVCSAPIRKRIDDTLGKFIGRLIFYAVMILALVAIFGRFGFEVTSFAAILAAVGFAIGMAFQGTLSNFAAGIMLLVFRPFKVGDVVNAAGITAKVNAIDLFTTTFDTSDNRRIVVPNSAIAGNTIENVSFHSVRRVDVSTGADYRASIDETRATLTRAAESLKNRMVEGEDRGFQIVLTDLGNSSVNWTVRFWCKAEDYWAIKEELTCAVKVHLDEANIGIPYPTMDINVRKSNG